MWNNTVTVYRENKGKVERTVIDNCRFEVKLEHSADIMGHRQEAGCFLAVPGDRHLRPGDRVMGGIGPEMTGMLSHIPGLVTLTQVQPYYLNGVLHHTEARTTQ